MNSLSACDLQFHLAREILAEPVVRLEGISVRYRAPEERLGTFKEYALRRLQRPVRYTDFYALHQVTMEVRRGEMFAIIGRNGAGKSTLLKVISRVVSPSSGRLQLRGHVSPLLELGAGFHPELTGRENIFLNGTLLGHSHREIAAKLEDVLDFAELGRFIEAPLRTYSSGMVARLGFSVATAWQPDILLLDEVLAVGDDRFRAKCRARMDTFRGAGTTILLVTHDMGTVESMCTRALWLQAGRVAGLGETRGIVEEYLRSNQ
jgi:ABC-type polysaccharide/polyol phosphate transport system ATPase subunit